MKHLLTLSTILLSSALLNADSLEFRTFTIKNAEGTKTLTDVQIRKALSNNLLGVESSITVDIIDGSFEFTDTKPIDIVVEYDSDFTVAKTEQKNIGHVLEGSYIVSNDEKTANLSFNYSSTVKNHDICYRNKNGLAILQAHLSSTNYVEQFISPSDSTEWTVFPQKQTSSSKEYIAVRHSK
ncbi:hypothetical protein [Rubritalea sp.]|uniref:hypothetical protein n=1 Tax=Rubritalea sp. TaxID=2109375 RepID=UPI003EF2B4C6